ncbi:hypothetical protein [Sphingomonas sp.]|uniref:hypothetical protein n=1 Tax=Sphingomonas sp. TaxID=28214 RepID=UPI002DD65C26|nr:hypothetical protein [Sphingomonas sp.]
MKKFSIIAALAALALPSAASTQTAFPLKMTGQHGSLVKGKTRVAIASYGINFIVAQKGTAVAGVGLNSRVVTGLSGVDEATMRRLANEGYADLKAQLAAAGLTLVSEAETRGAIQQAGTVLLPGNTESNRDGGITIGKGVKKASVAYGADGAPLTDIYPASGKAGGFGMLAAIGKVNKLAAPGKALDTILLFPLLTVDYADTEAKQTRTLTGARRGIVETNVAFGIRMQSPVNVVNPGYMAGAFYPSKDVWVDTPFSKGATEMTAMANDSAYMMNVLKEQKAGNVAVDLPAWTALVKDAYRAYNASIVAILKDLKAKG